MTDTPTWGNKTSVEIVADIIKARDSFWAMEPVMDVVLTQWEALHTFGLMSTFLKGWTEPDIYPRTLWLAGRLAAQ